MYQLLSALKPVLLAVRCCFVQLSVCGLHVCMLKQAALLRPSFPTTSPWLGRNNHLTQWMCKVVSKRFYLQSIRALRCAVCALHGDCLMSKEGSGILLCLTSIRSTCGAFQTMVLRPTAPLFGRSFAGDSALASWLGYISRNPVANADIQQMGR